MKPLAEQTHYEVLETEPSASADDVERAFRLARSAFAEDAVGLYSIYSEIDAQALRERIEVAYRVLSDPDSRAAYDAGQPHPDGEPEPELVLTLDSDSGPEPGDPTRVGPLVDAFDGLDDPDDENFDGARLRRSRLRRGLELEDIAKITKVNPRYLRSIEDERFDVLPAAVYVRGFVAAYARCVGLDPSVVAPAYMERFARGTPASAAGRHTARA